MSKNKATDKQNYRSEFLPFVASNQRLKDHVPQPQCGCRPVIDAALHMEICDGLIDILAALFNVSGRQLRSPKRDSKDIARVRQIGMYVARVTLCLNMRLIADGFARDKSTVTYACHLIEDLRDDGEFDIIISRVEQVVSAAFKHVFVERFQTKWTPVRRPETRQNKDLERFCDSGKSESALTRQGGSDER